MERTGVSLDVGKFPEHGAADVENDDPEQITKLTAHAVARAGDRFSFLRKLSRHLEGTERRAGILSDLLAALLAIYKRNPEVMEHLGRQVASEVQQRRTTVSASRNGSAGTPATGGVTSAP